MINSYMRNGVVNDGCDSSFSNAFSIIFPKQNWWTTSADFVASMAGAISVINWTSKNPQIFEFFNYNYGITKHEMLNGLKSPLSKIAKLFSYGIVVNDAYVDIRGYINAGDSWQITISSGIVTIGVGALNVWAAGEIGAAIGGTIGGVPGFIIGTVAGFVGGIIINGIFYIEFYDKSIANNIEDDIKCLLEFLFRKS